MKCQWCDKEFDARRKARYCSDQHYKTCNNPDCDNVFPIKEMKRPAKSCSRKCADALTKLNTQGREKICELCGDSFIASKYSDRFCSKKHFQNCVVCGKEFELVNKGSRAAKTCSKKCAAGIIDFTERNKKSEIALLNKYGYKNASQIPDVKEKKKESSQKRYGVDNVSQADEVKSKREETFLKKYNVKNPMFHEDFKKKLIETNNMRYGVDNPFQNEEIKKKAKMAVFEKYGVENIFLLPENQKKAAENSGKRISKVNQDWKKVLDKATGKDFDFEVPFGNNNYADLGYGNVLIDINPTITHNSSVSFVHIVGRCVVENCQRLSHMAREKDYHQKRALEAEKEGKILLQYFDWYNPEIFINIVQAKLHQSNMKVYARKTVLKEIKQVEANKFLEKNHLMGKSNSQSLCLGLFYDDELVYVQTYGQSRLNKNYEWEAIRSCSKLGYHIPGGFSKCDKYFFTKVQPESVISYVDLSVSQGKTDSLFEGWRMKSLNKPSAMWVRIVKNDNNNNDSLLVKKPLPMFIKDSTARRLSADRLLGFEVGEKYPRYDENGSKITNDFVLLSEGFVKVFDAGTRVYEWKKS